MLILKVLNKLAVLIELEKIEIKAHNDRMWIVLKVNQWFKMNMERRGTNIDFINQNKIRYSLTNYSLITQDNS